MLSSIVPLGAVKVSSYMEAVPSSTHTPTKFKEVWDTGNYFDPSEPTRIDIRRRPGIYQVLCTVRWIIPHGVSVTPTFQQEAEDYFYVYLTVNGEVLGNEARSTANRVTGAKGTSQVIALEHLFSRGDTIGLVLWNGYPSDYLRQIDALVYLSLRQLTFMFTPIEMKADAELRGLSGEVDERA